MAQTRNATKGKASEAKMSHDRTHTPDGKAASDMVAYLQGRQSVIVTGKSGIYVRGYAPGDDETEVARMINLPIGGMAKVVIDQPPAVAQDVTTLAMLITKGKIDVVEDAAEFGTATPHSEVHAAHRTADLTRQAKRAGAVPSSAQADK